MSRDDDAGLFRRTVGEVRPVRDDRIEPRSARRPPPRRRPGIPEPPAEPSCLEPRSADCEPESPLLHAVPGLLGTTLAKLRRGRYPVDARLDLHGATAAAAERVLATFVAEAGRRGYRCVLVVHGKGYRSPEGRPVLKGRVAAWLRGHAEVLAFVSATPADGGTGAVYVLLRRGNPASPRGRTGV